MDRVDYAHFIKPLLRACGLTLLILFLVSLLVNYFPLSQFTVPSVALSKVSQFLESGSLLAIALLLILLSIADHSPRCQKQDPHPTPMNWDGLLIRCRSLIAFLAFVYLLLIPYVLVQAQLVRNIGIRNLENYKQTTLSSLEKVRLEANKASLTNADVAKLLDTYPQLFPSQGSDNRSWLKSPQDLRIYLDASIKKVPRTVATRRRRADVSQRWDSIRNVLIAFLYSSLMWFYWVKWPKQQRGSKGPVNLEDIGFSGLEP